MDLKHESGKLLNIFSDRTLMLQFPKFLASFIDDVLGVEMSLELFLKIIPNIYLVRTSFYISMLFSPP